MSAIASFVQIPRNAVEGLRLAATPRKKLFGGMRDTYPDYLQQNGQSIAEYKWSGYVLATLRVYLQQRHDIDLMHSAYDELSSFLTHARATTCFIFTDTHKKAYLAKFDPPFSEEELRDYYNEFNATHEDQVGKAMLDGIRSLRQCLNALDDKSVVVFSIG
jgi:hypothetical protein